ncbi:MAG: FtsL-like putative cell division protein [Flavobacteriales bacterium]
MNTIKKESTEGKVPHASKKRKRSAGRYMQRLLNGEYLVKEGLVQHMPFIGYLVLLFILNIGMVYYFENTQREKHMLQSKLNELRSQYNTTLSELETNKQQSHVARDIEAMGLKELTAPPEVIDVDKNFLKKQ